MNSVTRKTLLAVNDMVYINADDVSTIEYEKQTFGYWGNATRSGSIITMKSGRKIFVVNVKPDEIFEKMQGD